MKQIKRCIVAGGDERQIETANCLISMNITVFVLGLESASGLDARAVNITESKLPPYDAAFLPVPLSSDGVQLFAPFSSSPIFMTDLFEKLDKSVPVFAGRISPQARETADRFELRLIDCFTQPQLQLLNAVPTAEGAIQIAMDHTKRTLWDSRLLVCGFGKVAKALCQRLRALSSSPVAVFARRGEIRTEADCCGFDAVDANGLYEQAGRFDVIFNTVPSEIIGKELLAKLKPGALIIDLASLPGGVDFAAAKGLGIQTIHALSLPSKVAPVSAAANIIITAFGLIDHHPSY